MIYENPTVFQINRNLWQLVPLRIVQSNPISQYKEKNQLREEDSIGRTKIETLRLINGLLETPDNQLTKAKVYGILCKIETVIQSKYF